MTEDHAKTSTFELDGRPVEITFFPARWRVRVGEHAVESRRLDEALEQALGKSAALVRLAVDVMAWAFSGE